MDVVTLLVVFVGLMVLALVYAALVPQRPPTVREITVTLTAELKEVERTIGWRLQPVVAQAAAALRDFNEAIERAERDMSETSSRSHQAGTDER